MRSKKSLILFTFFYTATLAGQMDTIFLRNNSFEGVPHIGNSLVNPVEGWFDCGNQFGMTESPPDLHGEGQGIWGVQLKPNAGQSYVGLVTRYNDTWESISQHLFFSLKANKCYTLHAFLCRSPVYRSPTRRSKSLEDFSHPVILRIFGGNDFCDELRLLAISAPISNTEWTEYVFSISPPVDCTYITIEAYYDPVMNEPYNGHVLIDNLSPIMEKPCD